MLAIYKKELRAYFTSVIGWMFLAFFLAFVGLYVFLYNFLKSDNIQKMIYTLLLPLYFLKPKEKLHLQQNKLAMQILDRILPQAS